MLAGHVAAGYFIPVNISFSHSLLTAVIRGALPPDMPLAPDLHRDFGLGLWMSIPATRLVEGRLWLLAFIVFFATRAPLDPRARMGSG